eukprot:5688751-Prymnesium_polylepis.1
MVTKKAAVHGRIGTHNIWHKLIWVKSDANSFGWAPPPCPTRHPPPQHDACLNALAAHAVKCVSVLLGGGAWSRGATRSAALRGRGRVR